MLPTSRGETWRSTRPLRNPSTASVRAHVSLAPETSARPTDSRTWIVGGSGPAPIAPYTFGRGEVVSVSVCEAGTPVPGSTLAPRSTPDAQGRWGWRHTVG